MSVGAKAVGFSCRNSRFVVGSLGCTESQFNPSVKPGPHRLRRRALQVAPRRPNRLIAPEVLELGLQQGMPAPFGGCIGAAR